MKIKSSALAIVISALIIVALSGCSKLRSDAGNATSSGCGASDCHSSTMLKSYYPVNNRLHQIHVRTLIAVYPEPCSLCHFDYNRNSYHKNGKQDSSTNNSLIVNFDPGVNPGGSFDMSAGTCSSLSCHGTVAWDPNAANTCTAVCHQSGNVFPGAAPDPMASGSHNGHMSGTALTCVDCHADYKDKATHDNGTLDSASTVPGMVTFNSTQNPGSTYNPATHQCAGTICHGNFTGGNNSSPSWGVPGSAACGSCHGGNPSGNPAGSSNPDAKHGTHVSMLISQINSTTGINFTEPETCSVCHAAISSATHNNGQIDISFTYAQAGSLGSATGGNVNASTGQFNAVVCSNTYCHGNFTGGSAAAVSWSDTVVCGSCHPAGATAPTSVKHTKHLAQYTDQCAYCHSGYTKSSINSAKHLNFVKDVDFGYSHPSGTAGNPSFNSSSKTCSNVYCHGNFPRVTYNGAANTNPGNGSAPAWLDGSSAACGSCHGSASNNYSSNTHGKHTANTSNYFNNSSSIESCDACHYYGTDGAGTGWLSTSLQGSYGTANHADFSINNSGVNADVNFKADNADLASKISPETLVTLHTTWNPGSTTCTNSWCHGNFSKPGTLVGNNATSTPNWLISSTAACGTCHTATLGTSGAHTKHTAGTAGNYSYGCGKCHGVFSGHVNGTIAGANVAVSFDSTNPNGSYATSTQNCSDLYCHGNTTNIGGGNDWGSFSGSASAKNDNPVWTGGLLTCGVNCHSATTATLSTGSHTKHIGSSAVNYSYPCRRCHDDTYSGDTANFSSGHADGILSISFQQGMAGPYDTLNIGGEFNGDHTCTNTYCHGNFTGGKQASSTVPVWGGGALTCGTEPCHYLAPLKAVWGSHDKHTNTNASSGYNYDCVLCHSGIASGKEGSAIILTGNASTTGHADFTRDVVFSGLASQYTSATSSSYDGASHTCSYTYCHGAFGLGATKWLEGNAANTAVWGGTAACGTCHGTTSGLNAGMGIPNSTSTWSSNESHVRHAGTASSTGYAYPCGFCHKGVYDAVLSIGDGMDNAYESGTRVPGYTTHADGSRTGLSFYTQFTMANATVTAATGLQDVTCGNIYCHSDGWATSTLTNDSGYANPRWGGAGKSVITCMSCHNNGAGDPWPRHNDTGGKDHYNPSNSFKHQTTCMHCHANSTSGTTNTSANVIRYSLRRHVNHAKNVSFSIVHTDPSGGNRTYSRALGGAQGTCRIVCHESSSSGSSKDHNPANGWYNLGWGGTAPGLLRFEVEK